NGSVAHTYLMSRVDLTIVPEQSMQHLLFNLLAGQIDMILVPTPNIMKIAIDAGVEERIKVLQPPVMEMARGMALRPADEALRQRLDRAIDDFVRSDNYREIYERWWGRPKPFWNTTRLLLMMALLVGGVTIAMTVWRCKAISRLNQELRQAFERADRERMKSDSILESINDGISIQDSGMRVIYQNASHIEMLGAHIGELCYQAYYKRDSVCDECLVHATFQDGSSNVETRCVSTPSGFRYFEICVSPIRDEHGQIASVIECVRDITERRQAEEQRHKDLVFIETLMQNSPMGIRVFDAESAECVMVNQAAADIAGGTVAVMQRQNFRSLNSWKAANLLATAEEVIADGIARMFETEMCTSFGKQVAVVYFLSRFVANGKPYLLIMGRDITEEKRIEAENERIEKQLLHTQKLESLGVLAGGIAHDFNNILTAILGNTELALMRLNPESPVLDNLQRIEKSAVRATDLAKQMLAYSGKGKFVVENIDLNRLIEEMGHMLEVSISKKAVLHFNLTRPLPSVEADATQIRQIVMNLVINASEAIGDRSGVIAVTTGSMVCDQKYLKDVWQSDGIAEGLYVRIEISDTGCGMDKETMARIFDPFFTTKFTGRGLGMAAVQGIVRGHKGAISVYSESGKGSSFKILLPASGKAFELSKQENRSEVWKGSGLVLLADDEETVRNIGREMLMELGFDVATASDGREALDIFKSRSDIHAVILDLTMPHIDGEQAFNELRMLKPDARVIISSGYSEYEVTRKFAGKGLAGFISKPYKLSALRDAMRSLDK
ncbi:MAG: response regulator, partial [Pseudomonadota bacterium]